MSATEKKPPAESAKPPTATSKVENANSENIKSLKALKYIQKLKAHCSSRGGLVGT